MQLKCEIMAMKKKKEKWQQAQRFKVSYYNCRRRSSITVNDKKPSMQTNRRSIQRRQQKCSIQMYVYMYISMNMCLQTIRKLLTMSRKTTMLATDLLSVSKNETKKKNKKQKSKRAALKTVRKLLRFFIYFFVFLIPWKEYIKFAIKSVLCRMKRRRLYKIYTRISVYLYRGELLP